MRSVLRIVNPRGLHCGTKLLSLPTSEVRMTPALDMPAMLKAAEEFAKPEIRAQVLKWHEEGKPLLDMADELGIRFSDPLRKLIAGLKPDEVATIRKAMVAAIGNDASVMPVDCDVETMPASIVVTPDDKGGTLYAKVVTG